MNLRFALPVLVLLELCGCAAGSAPDGHGSRARLILDPLMTRRNVAAGVLQVRRDAVAAREACRHRIFLDGNAVADLRPNEVVTIYAPPGEHVLRAEQTGPSCHGGSEIAATSERGRSLSFMTLDPAPDGDLLISMAR
ncbi:MAG: hypothetical protein ACXWIG_03375 [Caldimonas sp.]